MKISVRELTSRLSQTLRRVADGEQMIVTSRGKVMARLLPPRARRGKALSETELIERFRRLPGVRAGSGGKPALPKPLVRIGKGENTLAQIVSEQRG